MDKQIAAQTIRRMAVQYQHMVYAADCLDELGGFEASVVQAKDALAKMGDELNAATSERDAAHAAVAAAREEAQEILDSARKTSDERAEKEEASVAEVMSAAHRDAKIIINRAVAQADAALYAGSARESAIIKQIEDLEAARLVAEMKAKAADDDAEAAQARLAAARDSIQKLLG